MNIAADLKNVMKTYAMGDTVMKALQGMSLTVELGEFVVLTGPSGCGKTTLLNMIGCIDQPDSGQVNVLGFNVLAGGDVELSKLRRERIGYIFQNFNLLPALSCLENVMYPLRLRNDREAKGKAREALAKVGLEGLERHRPNQLSGGQRQRCAVARAFAGSPDLIIADEPTANLDSKNSAQIIELIFNFISERRTTFVTASHHVLFINNAKRVVRMVDGALDDQPAQPQN